MATYEKLTEEQKNDLRLYERFTRGLMSSLTTLHRQSGADEMAVFAATTIDPILDDLENAEELPIASDHAGAKPVTAGELKTARQIMRDMRQLREQHAALLVKLVGVNA